MFGIFTKKRVSKPVDVSRSVVWRCDSCEFHFVNEDAPYLEMIDFRTGEAFVVVGRGEEFGDYETSNEQEAIESGLDVMHLYDVPITYDGKTDEELGYEYGEYGSNPVWLKNYNSG